MKTILRKGTRIGLSCFLLIFFVLQAMAQQPAVPTLTIGDAAPKLDVHHWLKGAPIDRFEKGHVYVVEFWATWCTPCIAAMPHLSELARQYRGKVTVIGVNVWEGNSKPLPDVASIQRFVDEKGSDMDYTVAMDEPGKNVMADSWLKASAQPGIPASFIVDQSGNIAWIGHPSVLDPVLKKVVETPNEFDVKEAKEQYDRERALQAKQSLVRSVLGYTMARNFGMAFHQTRKLMEEDADFERSNFWVVVRAYLGYNGKVAKDYIEEKLKDRDFVESIELEKDGGAEEVLDVFAKLVAQQPGLTLEMYYESVARLQKLLRQDPDDYLLLSVLAQAYASLNEPEKAITAQEKAISLFLNEMKTRGDFDKEMLMSAEERMQETLQKYRDLSGLKSAFGK